MLELFKEENKTICGVDEAGRGCLAGPVVAAAVILLLFGCALMGTAYRKNKKF